MRFLSIDRRPVVLSGLEVRLGLRFRFASLGILLGLPGCGSGGAPDLALLPLEVVGGYAETLALADTLRRGLACRLEQRGIRVALRAVDELPSESLAPPERVGRRLGATWVLSGSVFTDREHIRVVLHLTQVHDDRGAWVGSFHGPLAGRDTLNENMARALGARLPTDSPADGRLDRARLAECNEGGVPD